MRAFEPVMIRQIDIFIQQLLRSNEEVNPGATPINMTQQSKYLTVDVMGYLAFGYPLNLQTEATNRTMALSQANFYFNIAMQLPFLGAFRVRTLRSLRSFIRGKRYLQSLEKVMVHRLSEGQHVKHDLLFMSDQLKVPEDNQAWLDETRSEAIWFLIAGSWIIY